MAIPATETGSTELAQHRAHLDEIDREMMGLLARRIQLAQRAARAEAREGKGSERAREESLLEQRRGWAAELGLEKEAEVFFRTLQQLSRNSDGTDS